MTRHHSSKPPSCVLPRAHTDASQRFQTYGPVQSMDDTPPDFSIAGYIKGVAACLLLIGVFVIGIAALTPSGSAEPAQTSTAESGAGQKDAADE